MRHLLPPTRRATRNQTADRTTRSPRRRVLPLLEACESRTLLTAYTVTIPGDAGSAIGGVGAATLGDLRYCLNQAEADGQADTITFNTALAAPNGTIQLQAALPTLNNTQGSIAINGPGQKSLTILGSATGTVTPLSIEAGATASITGVTLSGGHGSVGGWINNRGNLLIAASTLSGNSGSFRGGAIYEYNYGSSSSGQVTITNSTFSNNSATDGGGIYTYLGNVTVNNSTFTSNSATGGGGAIINIAGTFTVTNSTISGNTAGIQGGGIVNDNGSMTLINNTITGNSVTRTYKYTNGGGLDNEGFGTLTLTNTIVAGNMRDTLADDIDGHAGVPNTHAVSTSSSNNLIGIGGSGGLTTGSNGNLVGITNALLGPLGNYGGPTQTVPLLPGSPAINAGTNATGVPTTDQRGKGRVGAVDIGAFESQGFTLTPVSGSTPQTTTTGSPFANPLAVTVSSADGSPVAGGVVTYNLVPNPAGAGATLSGNSATIDANDQAQVVATANYYSGSYSVVASTSGIAMPATFQLTNRPPVGTPAANNQSVNVAFNTATPITLTGSDPDQPPLPLTYTVTTSPMHGTLTGTAPNLTYTPTTGYSGPDSFQFTTNNGTNTSAPGTVSISVAMPTPPPQPSPTDLQDGSFETPVVGDGNFSYGTTGSPWTFTGRSGISGNGSAFTAGNAPAPDGVQVAFVQIDGSFTQNVTFSNSGSYALSFDTAQRGDYGTSHETFEVDFDGQSIGTFTPGMTGYQAMRTMSFTAAAGTTHAITFRGLTTDANGDNTALIDAVALTTMPTPSTAPQFADSSFETPAQGNNQFTYMTTGSPWTFTGRSGIAANDSAFTGSRSGSTPQAAPDGTQVAFVQIDGAFSQALDFGTGGSFRLSLQAAQRANDGTSNETFGIFLDGSTTPVATFNPTTTTYQSFETPEFTVGAGMHTVRFVGLNTNAQGDSTAFIDTVHLTAAAQVSDGSFEMPAVGSGQFSYGTTGSPWTFTGRSGISGNDSAFTGSRTGSTAQAAPDGSQVAFVQLDGSFTQALDFDGGGTYTLSLLTAQRGNNGTSTEAFAVYLDGTQVGLFDPATTTYELDTSAAFTVTAGMHTIRFVGLNTAGDSTALIDEVSLNLQS